MWNLKWFFPWNMSKILLTVGCIDVNVKKLTGIKFNFGQLLPKSLENIKVNSVNTPPIYLWLIFLNLYFKNFIFELHFLSISNLIFTACVACKNSVRKRQKIKCKNQFRELEISKIKCRWIGGQTVVCTLKPV